MLRSIAAHKLGSSGCVSASRRLLCTTVMDAHASGELSVRQRLRRTPIDRDTLALIHELGVGMRKRGRRSERGEEQSQTRKLPSVLSKMGFVQSSPDLEGMPPPALAEIAFAGRSNVGKSSLLNALSGNRTPGVRGTVGVAAVANRPGVTRTLNFYANPLGASLVDLPGYGFAYAAAPELAQWQGAMREYLARRGGPLRVLLLVDARQSLKQSDRDFCLWLDREAAVRVHSDHTGTGRALLSRAAAADGLLWRARTLQAATGCCRLAPCGWLRGHTAAACHG